ncbi:MAG: rod shape-determining protein RodA [Burkholderiales bacterium]|nr:rod shape-determining protein RodA [Burkholderiales bacterium]
MNRSRRWLTLAFGHFDPVLCAIVATLVAMGLVVQFSATYETPGRFYDQLRNIGIGLGVLWVASRVPPQTLMRAAVPAYALGVLLLVAVFLFGLTRKGATRWLDIGPTTIQPSEIMKIAMPLMIAWYFHKHESMLRVRDFFAAAVLLAVPVLLIAKQPDLGTALLVFAAGMFVIFFAGLSWRLIIPVVVAGTAAFGTLIYHEEAACAPEVAWPGIKEYQRQRVCTLLDPSTDPLGKGFHTIQSTIAVGSGGITGKGWLRGTQTHLEFIPERHTDFIFAVYAEEFGLIGNAMLLLAYLALLGRGLMIAANAPTVFTRLLAAAISMILFTYAFVNIGMVSGILPVVGVPLPFVSYGGTALVTLFLGIGILMSIQKHRKLVQT